MKDYQKNYLDAFAYQMHAHNLQTGNWKPHPNCIIELTSDQYKIHNTEEKNE